VSIIGFVVLIYGYYLAWQAPVVVWVSPVSTKHSRWKR
jgi:hypothetical protein